MMRMFRLESLLLIVLAAASKDIQAFVMVLVLALIGASAHAIMTVIPLVAGAAIPQLITPPPPRTVATGG